jgi:hypothetical protein
MVTVPKAEGALPRKIAVTTTESAQTVKNSAK